MTTISSRFFRENISRIFVFLVKSCAVSTGPGINNLRTSLHWIRHYRTRYSLWPVGAGPYLSYNDLFRSILKFEYRHRPLDQNRSGPSMSGSVVADSQIIGDNCKIRYIFTWELLRNCWSLI